VRDGVPDAAGGGVRHTHCVFSGGSPTWFHSRPSEGWAVSIDPAIAGSLIRHRIAFLATIKTNRIEDYTD
jgi:hypothetical protein